jgi:hypothetical protein
MRTLLTGSLFALAVLIAACGGGGKSGVIPGVNSGVGSGPSSAKNANAVIVLRIPAPGQQVSRRPFYVSGASQSLGVLAVAATSSESPTPTDLTIYPVATPSPCAAASGGGYTCTLNVTAPIGVDNFFVATFATASPNANAVPLSEYAALGITVSASPGPNATPLTFTLDGVVYSVAVTVPAPSPGNTEHPNTIVFPAGVPVSPLPLGVTALDSNNTPILTNVTNTFATPLVIAPSPAGEGVSVSMNGATCSTSSGGSVTINCAADLNKVQFAYDGTTTPDPNDHVVDTFTVAATGQQVSATPSPATVVLSSNVLTYQIPTNGSNTEMAFLQRLSSGALLYVTYTSGNAYIGTFIPSTATVNAPATLSAASQDTVEPEGVAVTSSGAVWMLDEYEYPNRLDCWTTDAGGASAQAGILFYDPTGEDQLYPVAITVDGGNNLWYVGYDTVTEQQYAGYFAAGSGCVTPSSTNATTALTGDSSDGSPFVAPLSNGIAYNSNGYNGTGGVYVVTTSSGGAVSVAPAALGSSSNAGGIGAGADGSTYAAFSTNTNSGGDIEKLPSGGMSLSTLLDLIPSVPVDEYSAYPYGLSVFSLNGVADRINYVDSDFEAMGVVGNVQTTPTTMLISLPNVFDVYATAYSAKGGEYALYQDESENLYIARSIQTTTWSIPTTVLSGGECGTSGLLSINQRAPSSGPFTITNVPAGGNTAAFPGTYNDFLITPNTAGPFTITVTDASGRSEQFTMTFNEGDDC